jgi:spore germination protein KB
VKRGASVKITGVQLFWIMFCFQVHYALTSAFIKARQDAWMVSALAGILILAITFMLTRVSLLSPDKTIVEYSRQIFGKWFGKFIVVPYLIAWFMLTVATLRDWADFVYMILLPNTPILMVIVLMALLMTYVTLKGGITAIGRCSEVIGPLYLLASFVPIFFLFNTMDWRHLQPVYVDTGWRNILQGTIPTTANTLGGVMVPLMLTAFMAEPKKAPSRALWAMGLSSFWALLATVVSVLIFGAYLTPQLTLPWVMAIRSISILDFIQNFDAFAIFIYAFSHFVALSTILFMTSYGIAQWSNVKNWKNITIVVVILACVCVILTSRIGLVTNIFRQFIWVRWIFPVNMIGIPLLLWIVGSLKKRRTA